MMPILALILTLLVPAVTYGGTEARPVWPSPPDTARVEFVREIRCADLKPQKGLFGAVARVLGGRTADETLSHPFDVITAGGKLYMTCQGIAGLVEVDLDSDGFRLYSSGDAPFSQPIALCAAENSVFITDTEMGSVFQFDGKDVAPFITEGLARPTGIAWDAHSGHLYVVDTGEHHIRVFDLDGQLQRTVGERGDEHAGFNYPTFATARGGVVYVNDTLNYQIKLFAADVRTIAFGREGDGPGAFARPKGVAVDDSGNVFVVDGLFDNVQVFDPSGHVLLVIGSAGSETGQFWSPTGIHIAGDYIYVADTFNHRIQILRIVGG